MCPKVVPKPHTVVILFSGNTKGEIWCSSFTGNDHTNSDHNCKAPKDSCTIFQKNHKIALCDEQAELICHWHALPWSLGQICHQSRLNGTTWCKTAKNVHTFPCSFPVNPWGSKTPTSFVPFHINYYHRGRISIHKYLFSCKIYTVPCTIWP